MFVILIFLLAFLLRVFALFDCHFSSFVCSFLIFHIPFHHHRLVMSCCVKASYSSQFDIIVLNACSVCHRAAVTKNRSCDILVQMVLLYRGESLEN